MKKIKKKTNLIKKFKLYFFIDSYFVCAYFAATAIELKKQKPELL